MFRDVHKNNGAKKWRKTFKSLSSEQSKDFLSAIHNNQYNYHSKYMKVNTLLSHYVKPKEKSLT